MPSKVFVLRGDNLIADIDHEENNVTSYRISATEPITAIHTYHLQLILQKVNQMTRNNYTLGQMLTGLGLTDTRE